MEQKILFVDDEQNVLTAIRRMLFDEHYEQLYASSGEEALMLITRQPVDVIISDMRMPVMDGVAFLEKSREILPDAVRIILSGQSDMFSVMQA
ncbi:MAG: response regulator, partial [Chitinispirillaceae bacterium]|nr:response regulator [Chitinispirillaceae bacterium]